MIKEDDINRMKEIAKYMKDRAKHFRKIGLLSAAACYMEKVSQLEDRIKRYENIFNLKQK